MIKGEKRLGKEEMMKKIQSREGKSRLAKDFFFQPKRRKNTHKKDKKQTRVDERDREDPKR